MAHRGGAFWAISLALGILLMTLGDALASATSAQPATIRPLPLQLGNYTIQISTNSTTAQKMFNLGLMHEFGFNQKEARLAMNAAVESDPLCAMCHWGVAYVNGPFLNHPVMTSAQALATYTAIRKAVSVCAATAPSGCSSTEESGLIHALLQRYPSPDASVNQTIGFVAYVDALQSFVEQIGPDAYFAADAQALLAEAEMNLESNDYYVDESMGDTNTTARAFRPYSVRAATVLRAMLDRSPTNSNPRFWRHPLALHLWIHLTEPAVPGRKGAGAGRGENAADLLLALSLTGSGHLEHMPGHLYLRIGRYADAVEANKLAAAADADYTHRNMTPYGPCHNTYFGVYAACMAGMKAEAVRGSIGMRDIYQVDFTRADAPGPEQGWNALCTTYLRFGDWEALLMDGCTLPDTAPAFPYARVLQHYARGLAILHSEEHHVQNATAELAALQMVAAGVSTAGGLMNLTRLVDVANLTLSAAIARSTGDLASAIALLQTAAIKQNSWHYDEPPDWHAPVLQCLGKVLLDAGDAAAAEQVYLHDLAVYSENGWGLTGLVQAMEAQPKVHPSSVVAAVKTRLISSWEHADVPLPTSSCAWFEF